VSVEGKESMSKQDEIIIVGKFGSSYGIRGWLKVVSYTDIAENIFDYKPLHVNVRGEWVEISVESWKRHKGLVCKLDGLDVREEAQTYTNLEIGVAASALPKLSEDEFYWRELFGMEVTNVQGYGLGEVVDLMETGSNDVLVVKANLKDAFGKKERLIPFLDGQVIKSIDRTAQRIEVDWDPGF
jgi:16S rRNA processing protein RimM